MLVAIGVFRASGTLDYVLDGIEFLAVNIAAMFGYNLDTRWVEAMPTAIMKPLSGSGARGAMTEVANSNGVASFPGTLAAIFQGSTETTFYTLAVYYGAIKVTNTRYTLWAGLLADLAGIVAAIVIAYLFFSGQPESTM